MVLLERMFWSRTLKVLLIRYRIRRYGNDGSVILKRVGSLNLNIPP